MSWPVTTTRKSDGQLAIGGVGVRALADEFGTPLYVFDEATLRERAQTIVRKFHTAYPASRVVYAGKALLSPAIVSILHEEGLGLDVVSGGEIFVGVASGVPASDLTFHGNNKDETELREAIAAGVGLIVVDNDWEIELLARLVTGPKPVRCLLRLNPGVEAHTHEKMRTGVADSKFGLPIWTGHAEAAVERLAHVPSVTLVGYHAHIGSQVFDPGLVGQTLEKIIPFASAMRDRHGVQPDIVSPGGGFGVSDDASGYEASIKEWALMAASTLRRECERHRLSLPTLVVEPGRAIVGPAGVALYRVGARKEIPGVRTYVSVDGGMADNIRPALYGAKYTAEIANRQASGASETVTIAGKYCESGDVLIGDLVMPRTEPGDLLAVPMAGAYCLAMASNYNLALRPAAVLVSSGRARLFRRRETYDDLLAIEVRAGSEYARPDVSRP